MTAHPATDSAPIGSNSVAELIAYRAAAEYMLAGQPEILLSNGTSSHTRTPTTLTR